MRKYVVASANSYGNVGDDICAYSAAHLLRQIDPDAEVSITSPPYEADIVETAQAIILGGGGILYDLDKANVDNYMEYLEHARRTGKAAAALGLGVQGIVTNGGKQRYQQVLSKIDVLTTRSPADELLLREIGIDNVVTTQDLGFLTDEWVHTLPQPQESSWLTKKNNDKPNLGLGIMDLRSAAIKHHHPLDEKVANFFADSMESNIEDICSQFNVYLFAHSRDDASWNKRLARKYPLTMIDYKFIEDFPRFWAVYQEMDLVIGSRFHAIILGCLSRKPTIGIGMESKKQSRLANYEMDTLKKQFFFFEDLAGIRDLFGNLHADFAAHRYLPLSEDELQRARRRAGKNSELLHSAWT